MPGIVQLSGDCLIQREVTPIIRGLVGSLWGHILRALHAHGAIPLLGHMKHFYPLTPPHVNLT